MNAIAKKLTILFGVLAFASSCTATPNSSTETQRSPKVTQVTDSTKVTTIKIDGDYTASEDDEVLVDGVSKDPNALGYFGYAYYEKHQDKLKALAIDNGKGAVLPSTQTII